MKSVEMSVDGRNLPVAALQPYFSDYVNVSLTNGQVSAKGKVVVVPGEVVGGELPVGGHAVFLDAWQDF